MLYVADPERTQWSERVLRQCDDVLFVVPVGAQVPEHHAVADLTQPTDGGAPAIAAISRRPKHLVLLQEGQPTAASTWLDRLRVDRHFHIKPQDPRAVARLARSLTGSGIGLVLSGGAARAAAHVGVLQALEEARVDIDFVAGVSVGAIVAAAVALGKSSGDCLIRTNDYVEQVLAQLLPLPSAAASEQISHDIERLFGQVNIEDLALPYFCVATNLTRAQPAVYTRGSLGVALRASMATPGLLPPVAAAGDVLVDGGLLNNLPTDLMTLFSYGSSVIASDVSPSVDELSLSAPMPELSRLQSLAQKVRKGPESDPADLHIRLRANIVSSVATQPERAGSVALHLRPPVEEWSNLDFLDVPAIAERGHSSSIELVQRWVKARRQALRDASAQGPVASQRPRGSEAI